MYFVVERFWPGSTETAALAAMERLRQGCVRLCASGVDIRWVGGTFVPSDEAVSCRFEGTAHAVRAVLEIAGERFDRILPIVELESDWRPSEPPTAELGNTGTKPGGRIVS